MISSQKKKQTQIKAPAPSRTIERRFAEATENMIDLMSRQYENQVLRQLNVSTINKFTDSQDQSGNYARGFKKLSSRARKKLLRRFSNIRIERMAKDFLNRADRETSAKLYKAVERKVGIPAKQLAVQEVVGQAKNALILETTNWMTKLRDETLELYTANTLRAMTQGKGIEEIITEFAGMKEKRKNHAKFTARNQINNFNSIMTKTRAKKIGITKAKWQTSEDERVRSSHEDRNGKEFDLDEGLYSSQDGKTLLPATDYQCFEGDLKINNLPFASKMFRHRYAGKLSIICTDDGGVFRSTANHPIMTTNGFKPAQLIDENDILVKTTREGFNSVKIKGKDIIPTFEQVFNAFDLLGVLPVVSPAIGSNFHGDMTDDKINIIGIDSLLSDELNTIVLQKVAKFGFTLSEQEVIFNAFTCLGNSASLPEGFFPSRVGLMSISHLVFSLCQSHLTPLELFCFTMGTWFKPQKGDAIADNIATNAKMFRDSIFAFSVLVHGFDLIKWQIDNLGVFHRHFQNLPFETPKFSNVISNQTDDYEGFVYNFETVTGQYNTQETVVSNCRCTYILVFEGDDED